MTTPDPIQKGDTILIISPAGKVSKEKTLLGISVLEHEGYQVQVSQYAFDQYGSMSAEDEKRLEDLQWALDHPEAKVIFCSRGGYGCSRIIDKLNWDKFISNPKWLIGFSDITALHCKLQQLDFKSIHGPMASHLHLKNNQPAVQSMLSLLKTNQAYDLEGEINNYQRNGQAIGQVVGGNLALIVDQLGTDSDLDTCNKILFIEEVGEYLYKLDRMMNALKRAGKLSQLSGLIIGQLTDLKPNPDNEFPLNIYEIISEKVKEYSFPIAFGYEIGHEYPNYALVLGGAYHLNVQNNGTSLKYLPTEDAG